MAFKPETLDGQKAAATLLAKKRNEVHACLKEVFAAFPFERSDTGDYTSARVQWERTPKDRRHPGDRKVPAGAIVLFKLRVSTTRDPWPGHIAISLGGDRLVSTDWPTRGHIGIATIGEIEETWRSNEAEYLGWTDVIGGHNVQVGPRPGEGSGSSSGGKKPGRVHVVTTPTYLRRLPRAVRSTQIKPVKVGQRLRVIALTKSWATVLRTDGTIAYVRAVRLTPEKLTTTRSTPLRAAASRLGRLVRQLPKGTKLTVVGRSKSGRVQVQTGAVKGWAYRKHLA